MRLPCESSFETKTCGEMEPTLLELVLQLHGEFRGRLSPLHVTPLQAGALLFLHRHANAKVSEATTSLCVSLPTLSEVVKDLVRKRWVTKQYSVEDRRALCLQLSRQGEALVRRIMDSIRDVRIGQPI
jgi:DNA-binding MarR family transcriptional regulator